MKEKRGHSDRILNIFLAILVFFGYIMVISAHSAVALDDGFPKFAIEVIKITMFLVAGIVLMVIFTNRFKIKSYYKYQNIIAIIIFILMILTLFFPEVNGSKRWIRIPGGLTIQPIEFFKIFFILYLANYFSKESVKNISVMQFLKVPIIFLIVISIFVFVLQGDLGSTLIIMMITLFMYFSLPQKKFSFSKRVIFISIVILLILFYTIGPLLTDYLYNLPDDSSLKVRLLRIAVLFDPLKDVYGYGYQLTNSLSSFASSNILGAGLGNSEIKYLIPEPYNDAIIAVIAEETGIWGIIIVFGCYFAIINRLFVYAMKSKVNLLDRLVLIGIASFIVVQFFVNIGGMVGIIPMTGVTLLFVSSGGSSIITAFIAIGIAQSIIKRYNVK